jgi:transcriptional regulator with XRE-family HTH domain
MVSLIFQRLSSAGGSHVAEALGVSEATISRLKNEQAEPFAAFLACLRLKLVPAEHECYAPEYIEHLRYFAKVGMQQQEPPKLDWEDVH